jgi:hypothetical protein
MLMINANGVLVQPTLSGKDIPVVGVIFEEKLYAVKCAMIALGGKMQTKEQIIDDTVKFALK